MEELPVAADKVNVLGWVKICLCRGHSAIYLSTRHLPKGDHSTSSSLTLSVLAIKRNKISEAGTVS